MLLTNFVLDRNTPKHYLIKLIFQMIYLRTVKLLPSIQLFRTRRLSHHVLTVYQQSLMKPVKHTRQKHNTRQLYKYFYFTIFLLKKFILKPSNGLRRGFSVNNTNYSPLFSIFLTLYLCNLMSFDTLNYNFCQINKLKLKNQRKRTLGCKVI